MACIKNKDKNLLLYLDDPKKFNRIVRAKVVDTQEEEISKCQEMLLNTLVVQTHEVYSYLEDFHKGNKLDYRKYNAAQKNFKQTLGQILFIGKGQENKNNSNKAQGFEDIFNG